MSCSSPLMANISAKPLPESPLELDIKNAKKATLPGALFFTHHISQAIESVAATDSVFVFMGVTERLRQSSVLPMNR